MGAADFDLFEAGILKWELGQGERFEDVGIGGPNRWRSS